MKREAPALTRQAKSPRSSKCRGYSTHVSSFPPTTALVPSRPPSSLSTPSIGGSEEADGRSWRVSRASLPSTLLHRQLSHLSFSLGHSLLHLLHHPHVSDMKTVGRRTSERSWRRGLLKNALAPSANHPYPVAPSSARLLSLSGESVLDLENARYPDHAPGLKLAESISHAYTSHTQRFPGIRACAPRCCCAAYRLGERWEFLYERRADENNEIRTRSRFSFKYLVRQNSR